MGGGSVVGRDGYKIIGPNKTFGLCLSQCEVTGLHAAHAHYCCVDPGHEGNYLSVDIKHIFLKNEK